MSDDDLTMTRRNALRSIGAGATASAAGGFGSLEGLRVFGSETASETRRLVIEADGEVDYDFAVTGLLSPAGAPDATVTAGAGSGTTTGRHVFEFTGEFTDFDVDGSASVRVDKQLFDYESFPHRQLEIEANGAVNYRVAASGAVEVDAESPRTGDRRVEGSVADETHVVSYSGELTALDVDGDATVRRDGSVVDPEMPLPFDNLGTATVATGRNNGESYTVEFGHDAGVAAAGTAGNKQAPTTADGAVTGAATKEPTRVNYLGGFSVFEVPSFGRVRSPQQSGYVRCEPAGDETVEFELATTGRFADGGSRTTVTVEDGTAELVEVDGRLTEVVVGPEKGRAAKAVTLSLSPEPDPEAAQRSVALQLAAEFERAKRFRTLERAIPGEGRVRKDVGGLTAISAPKHAETVERDTVTYELTDLPRADRGETILTDSDGGFTGFTKYEWVTDDGFTAKMETQALPDAARAQDVSAQQVEQNAYIERYNDGPSTASASARGVDTTSVEFDVDSFRAAHAETDSVGTQGIFDDIWNAITGAVDWVQNNFPNVDIETKDLEEIGGDLAITSHTVKFDLAEELMDDPKWSRGLKGGNLLYSSAITFVMSDAASQLADNGEVTSCAACSVVAQIAFDIGCGAASAYICAATGIATGGVALVGCATFLGILCNLPNTEESMKSACSQAGAC